MFCRVKVINALKQDPTGYSSPGCKYSYFVASTSPDIFVQVDDPSVTYWRETDSFATSEEFETAIHSDWKNKPILAIIMNPEDPEKCENNSGAMFTSLASLQSFWKKSEYLPTMETIEGMMQQGATPEEVAEGEEETEGSGIFHGNFSILPGDFSLFTNFLGFPDWLWALFILWLVTRKKKKKEYHYYYG